MGGSAEMKNKFLRFIVLFIAMTVVFSSFVIAKFQIKKDQIELNVFHQGKANGVRGIVVWDNRMHYDGICSAQYDEDVPFESECADDFHFEEDTEVFDVHWIGAYWNDDNYNQYRTFLVAIREDKDTYGIVYYYNLEKDIVEPYEKEKHDNEIIKINSESEEE